MIALAQHNTNHVGDIKIYLVMELAKLIKRLHDIKKDGGVRDVHRTVGPRCCKQIGRRELGGV